MAETIPEEALKSNREPLLAFGRSIGSLISRIHTGIDSRLTQRTRAELGITGQQAWTIYLLASGRCSRASHIAQEWGSDSGAITRLLDRLEKQDLVYRTRNETDRRVIELVLTERGRELAQQVPTIVDQVLQQIQAGLTQEEVRISEIMLRRIYENCA